MVYKCVANGCRSGYQGDKTPEYVSFHSFPLQNSELLEVWVGKISRKNFTVTKHSKICSLHFSADSFIYQRSNSNITRFRRKPNKLKIKRLAPHAYPTIFPDVSINLSRKLKCALRKRINLIKSSILEMRKEMKIHIKTLIHEEMKHGHDRKLACACNEEYSNERFALKCTSCDQWLHPECLSTNYQTYHELVNNILCTQCDPQFKQLYCICQQPYDESMFYLCCNRCLEWFHGRCVGILQSEADILDEYICPNCTKINCKVDVVSMKALTGEDYKKLYDLISSLKSHQSSWPFYEPVEEKSAPDYYDVVEQPMDFMTMEKKLNEKQYYILKEFIGDLTKIFDNCRYYYPSDSVIYQCADDLESFFVKKIILLKDSM